MASGPPPGCARNRSGCVEVKKSVSFRSRGPTLPPPRRSKLTWLAAGVAVAAVYAAGAHATELNPWVILRDAGMVVELLREMVPDTKERWLHLLTNYLPRLREPLLQTVQIAILGTAAGAFLCVPLVVLASRNLAPHRAVYAAARGFMNLLRTIPELLYAAILVAAVGVGPLPGVLALTVFSAAVLAKLTSESVEAVDEGPLEALQAAGATNLQVLRHAVVPQVAPLFWSHCLYVFEVNIRASTVLGLVGAGGIGQQLRLMLSLFQYENAFIIILVTFVLVSAIDFAAGLIRERLV